MSEQQQQQEPQVENQEIRSRGVQGKQSVLSYLMSVKSDSSVNQGFNLMLSECIEYFDTKFNEYQKKYGSNQQSALLEGPDGNEIKFDGREHVFKHCIEFSVKTVESKFQEPMKTFKTCRELCESQYQSGIVNYFYRESCYKECRKAMEFETRPLVYDIFHKEKVFKPDITPEQQDLKQENQE